MSDTEVRLPSEIHKFSFWETLDNSIVVQDERPATTVSLYPSEASAVVVNPTYNETIIMGSCNRKSWFRNKLQRLTRDQDHQTEIFDEIEEQDLTPKELWKFELGSATERSITHEATRANIWDSNSHRFEWRIPAPDTAEEDLPLIRGEVDLIVTTPGEDNKVKVGIEIKSISGYTGQKQVFGTKSKRTNTWINKPDPKDSNLLQSALYAYIFCIIKQEFSFFKLVYLSRENGDRIEFDIDIVPEEQEDSTVKHRVYVNQEPYVPTLYIENILDRYKELNTMIVEDTLPPRDFSLQYSAERIQVLYNRNELTKMETERFESGKTVEKGDWQCSYCKFSSMCYDKKKNPIYYDTE